MYIYVLSHWLLLTLRCVISCSVERVEEGGGGWTQDGRTQPFSRVSGAYPAILSVMFYPFIFRADGDTSIVPTPSHRHAIFCVRWSLSPAALHCQKKEKKIHKRKYQSSRISSPSDPARSLSSSVYITNDCRIYIYIGTKERCNTRNVEDLNIKIRNGTQETGGNGKI